MLNLRTGRKDKISTVRKLLARQMDHVHNPHDSSCIFSCTQPGPTQLVQRQNTNIQMDVNN